jgi:hypothetical protein
MEMERPLSKVSRLKSYWPDHRVGRVLSFSPIFGIKTSPTPYPREEVGESQFRRGDIHCGTLYIYVLCGPDRLSEPEFANVQGA